MSRQRNGVCGAARSTRTSTSFRDKPRNVATIDFGTTRCSVTYQLNAHLAAGDEKPEILKIDESGPVAARVPSCILFDKEGIRHLFGYQARTEYYKMRQDLRPDFIYFEQIKMKLQHDEVGACNNLFISLFEGIIVNDYDLLVKGIRTHGNDIALHSFC